MPSCLWSWWESTSRASRSTSSPSIASRSPPRRSHFNLPIPGTLTPPRPPACASCGATATGSGRNGCRDSRIVKSHRSRSRRRWLVRRGDERAFPALLLYPSILGKICFQEKGGEGRGGAGRHYGPVSFSAGGAGRMAVKFCALKASPHELGAVVMQARCRRLDPSPRWTSLLVFSLAYKLESVLNFDTMSNFAIEAIVAAVYVACFGVTIHGWQAAEAYAVAPELSVVVVVLYSKLIIELSGIMCGLIQANLTTETIHGLFWIPYLLIFTIAIPASIFWITINLVRSYLGVPAGRDLWQLIMRANFFAALLCVATSLLTTYIDAMAAYVHVTYG